MAIDSEAAPPRRQQPRRSGAVNAVGADACAASAPASSSSSSSCRLGGGAAAPARHAAVGFVAAALCLGGGLGGGGGGRGGFGVVAVDAAQAQVFEQNCAARKLCNRPLEDRDPAANAVPEALQAKARKGHLKPLGHPEFDGSWAGEIDVLEDIDPATFWSKYWPKKPFLLKGWAKKSPAFAKWQEDDYIDKHFGEFKAKCEPKNEDRLTDYCNQVRFGQRIKCGKDTIPYTESYMRITKFLKHYRKPTFDKYIVTQMPDAMGADILLPNFHSCPKRHPADPGPEGGGRWMAQMYENNFWLSYNEGRNFSSSVIHYDMNHQIMCQFSGTKEWFMWDLSKEGEKIPLWSGLYDQKRHAAQGSDDSPVDGERVDLERWTKFGEARWYNATLEAGDCLYTPALLLHYVRSFGRNIAAMTMFQREERFDADCDGPGEPQTLDRYDVMWSFPEEDKSLLGWNMIKMGFPNWVRQFLWPLADMAGQAPVGKLTKKAFLSFVKRLAKKAEGVKGWKSRANEAFAAMDEDGDDAVEAERLFRSRGLRYLLKDFAVALEGGREDQVEDTEVDRYDLQGSKERRHLDL